MEKSEVNYEKAVTIKKKWFGNATGSSCDYNTAGDGCGAA